MTITEILNECLKDSKSKMMPAPLKVFHHKERKNTTIIFSDNTSATVHLKDGDTDDIEEAIIQCIIKRYFAKKYIRQLIRRVEYK